MFSQGNTTDSNERPHTTGVNSAFEAYINTEYIDANSNSSGNSVVAELNPEIDMPNSDMMCYLMEHEALNNNLLMSQMLDQNGVFYITPDIMQNFNPDPYNLPSREEPATNTTITTTKKRNARRKSPANSSTSHGSEEACDPSIGASADLVLTPEEEDMIANANPKERRQIRNKISARNFRLRKKEYVCGLELKVRKIDEELGALREAMNQSEDDKVRLRSQVQDLVTKFRLLTTQVPDLQDLSELDPLHELTINMEGQLVPATHLGSHQTVNSCRGLPSYESGSGVSGKISDSTSEGVFSNSCTRSFVKT